MLVASLGPLSGQLGCDGSCSTEQSEPPGFVLFTVEPTSLRMFEGQPAQVRVSFPGTAGQSYRVGVDSADESVVNLEATGVGAQSSPEASESQARPEELLTSPYDYAYSAPLDDEGERSDDFIITVCRPGTTVLTFYLIPGEDEDPIATREVEVECSARVEMVTKLLMADEYPVTFLDQWNYPETPNTDAQVFAADSVALESYVRLNEECIAWDNLDAFTSLEFASFVEFTSTSAAL